MATRFELGRLLATPGVLDAVEAAGDALLTCVARDVAGDWGTVDEGDRRANDMALGDGSRLFSAYLLKDGAKVWMLTKGDRSAKTLLLPDEY